MCSSTRRERGYVADGYGNKRVVVFDSETGAFKRMWGAFGNPPPATLAANPAGPQPQTTADGPPEFGLPHAIKISRDGSCLRRRSHQQPDSAIHT